MAEIEKLIIQAEAWRLEHRAARRPFDALYAAVRQHALIDAYEAIGGKDRWRNAVGIFPLR